MSDELEEIFKFRPRFKCKCPRCGHEWIYVPRFVPDPHVTCPKCHRKLSLRLYCKLITKTQT